jgi:DNA polymerase-3 subunit alpha
MASGAAAARARAAGQLNFFDQGTGPRLDRPRGAAAGNGNADAAPDFAEGERLLFEKQLLGFYVSGHPMDAYEGLSQAIDSHPAAELAKLPGRTEFRLCGIVGGVAKKLSRKDNRPWAAFTLATRHASIPLNLFSDAYETYGTQLAENAPVVVLGNVIAGADGARINVKEIYPLDGAVTGLIRRATWVMDPAHAEGPAFLHELREAVNRQSGDTRIAFAFGFEEGAAPVAEASPALGWKLTAPAFQRLRAHPAVTGVQVEAKPPELKPDRRWRSR